MMSTVVLNTPSIKPKFQPAIQEGNSEMAEIRDMFRQMNQLYIAHQPSAAYLAAKRGMDLLFAIVLLLLTGWLFPIIALLVKLSSKGPVFFVQPRTGLHGETFHCLKFRTMRVNDEAHTRQATANDNRITRTGRFLRASHLDELPQLLNIFLGDMSLIGPRPHMLFHTRYYSGQIPFYHLRHEATPGMTGMAQINGFIGEITNARDLRKRIHWDIYYLKHRSIGLDFYILFQTFLSVLARFVPSQKKVS